MVSRLIANIVAPRLGDEAFIAGLLADIGTVAAWQCAPEAYGAVLASLADQTDPLHRVEQRVLGISHTQIGEQVLEHWSLPESLCRAVGAHHGDGMSQLSGETLDLARISFAAAGVAGFLCGDPPPEELPVVEQRLRTVAQMSAADANKVFNEIEAHVAETASLLSVNIDTTINSMIHSQATLRMAQLTHQMETECSDLAKRAATAREREEQLIQEQKDMLRAASTDFLTGLSNRAVFDQELTLCLTRAARSKSYVALSLLDVDHFKKVNDTYGHSAGDVVLRGVARALSATVREADIVARYGGEEFAVISSHENLTGASALAERIRKAVCQEGFLYNGQIISVTVSIGVALWHGTAGTVSEAVMTEIADKALYKAKKAGRNQVRIVSV